MPPPEGRITPPVGVPRSPADISVRSAPTPDMPTLSSPGSIESLDRASWLEMRTMLGWAPRWCEFCAANCQLSRQHDKEDRSSRKTSDLRKAQIRIEDGHSVARYFEIAFARSPGSGEEYTLRMRVRSEGADSAQEARDWMRAIQTAQKTLQQEERTARSAPHFRDFRIFKEDGGKVGLSLLGTRVQEVVPGGAAANAGISPGMAIVEVAGKKVGRKDAYEAIVAAPTEFRVRALLPANDPSVVGASLFGRGRMAASVMARAGYRKPDLRLPAETILRIAAFSTELCKIHVVFWGWGQDMETKRMDVPGEWVAADVHQRLDRDSKWQNARDGCTWDTKAVYFAGPVAGPTEGGKMRRVLPTQPLDGRDRGSALHIVSVQAKKHLGLFVTAVQRGEEHMDPKQQYLSQPLAASTVATTVLTKKGSTSDAFGRSFQQRSVPYETYRKDVGMRDREIKRLKALVAELRMRLEASGDHFGDAETCMTPISSALPWDEEEPPLLATLRNAVDDCTTLKDLERVEVDDTAAGFFTPEGSEADADDAGMWQGMSEGDIAAASHDSPIPTAPQPEYKWEGPASAPKAGSGTHVKSVPRGPLAEMGPQEACDGWSQGWQLRCGPDYRKTGKKVPSLDALYSFQGADLWRSSNPLENIAEKLQVPVVDFDTHGLPPTFIFNLQVPYSEAPSMWGQDLGGPTVNAALIFTCKESTAEAMRRHLAGEEPCPGAALIREYANRIPLGKRMIMKDDPFLGRFKLAVRADEGVPGTFSRYNGKPVLVTGSGRYFRSERTMEVDCNLRNWAYPARIALYGLWGKLGQFKVHVGICVEARDDSEMNERLLGCAQLSEVNWVDAKEWKD
eukprot:Hpha_TRINITY_DN12680_c0_g1::TRINITY_DN12680_c0_g1_i2::g.49938::m.49938